MPQDLVGARAYVKGSTQALLDNLPAEVLEQTRATTG
jgi:hypothetical protein